MMRRTLLGLALLVGLTTLVACGGDSDPAPNPGTGGTVVTGGTVATGGVSGTGGVMGPVMCGAETCTSGIPGLTPCCDEAAQKCGTTSPLSAGACSVPSEPHATCPSAGVDEIATPCCVEAENLCGLEVMILGCIDLARARGFVSASGASVPDPVHCDGTPVVATPAPDAGI